MATNRRTKGYCHDPEAKPFCESTLVKPWVSTKLITKSYPNEIPHYTQPSDLEMNLDWIHNFRPTRNGNNWCKCNCQMRHLNAYAHNWRCVHGVETKRSFCYGICNALPTKLVAAPCAPTSLAFFLIQVWSELSWLFVLKCVIRIRAGESDRISCF